MLLWRPCPRTATPRRRSPRPASRARPDRRSSRATKPAPPSSAAASPTTCASAAASRTCRSTSWPSCPASAARRCRRSRPARRTRRSACCGRSPSGLKIPFAELIGESRESVSLLRRNEAQVLQVRATARWRAARCARPGAGPGVEVYELRLAGHGAHASEPHAPGTRELITVLQGSLKMSVGEETYVLAVGDSLVFAADQHHVYENPGARRGPLHTTSSSYACASRYRAAASASGCSSAGVRPPLAVLDQLLRAQRAERQQRQDATRPRTPPPCCTRCRGSRPAAGWCWSGRGCAPTRPTRRRTRPSRARCTARRRTAGPSGPWAA